MGSHELKGMVSSISTIVRLSKAVKTKSGRAVVDNTAGEIVAIGFSHQALRPGRSHEKVGPEASDIDLRPVNRRDRAVSWCQVYLPCSKAIGQPLRM